jgi:hypothetical protein
MAKHSSFATSKRWFSRLFRNIKSRKKDALCYSEAYYFFYIFLFDSAATMLYSTCVWFASLVNGYEKVFGFFGLFDCLWFCEFDGDNIGDCADSEA